MHFSDNLQAVILKKDHDNFWKSWKSKVGNKSTGYVMIDGLSDDQVIAEKFASYFSNITNSEANHR